MTAASLPTPDAAFDPRLIMPPDLDLVGPVLTARIDDGAADLTAVDPALGEVVEQLRRLAAGGKRVRAAFCLWAARAVGAPAPVDVAAGLELFHLAALVHDDVMDRSEQRRGEPTIHRTFREKHLDAAGRGDAAQFGDAVAVLVGDLCLTWSDDLVARGLDHLSPTDRRAARAVWELMRTQVIAGQHLDVLAQTRRSTSAAATRKVLHYKSAAYTVEQPLRLGATLGGAPAHVVDGLGEVGLRVGTAFQLRDDVLGVFGDAATTGKPVGDDVREGKRTLLVAHAERHGSRAQRAALRRHLGEAGLDAAGLAAVRTVLHDTGAVGHVEGEIQRLMDDAHARLVLLSLDDGPRAAIGRLSDACAWRAA